MALFMLLLLAADPAGKFDVQGRRLEDVREAVNLTPEQEADFRTIAEWEKMATTARSKQRRTEGAHAVMRVCLHKHKTPLGEAETAAAYEVVIKLLSAEEVEVRREAASTLGRMGFLSSAVALRECAGKESDFIVRATCYHALGLLKDEDSVPLLAKAVASEKLTPAGQAARTGSDRNPQGPDGTRGADEAKAARRDPRSRQ